MRKFIDLPIVEPIYSTYQFQSPATAIIENNPSIKNWILSNVMLLSCNRKFLSGLTTPYVNIVKSSWIDNPHLDLQWMSMIYLNGHVNSVIKILLNHDFYVYYRGVDDFYMEGKSYYKERHFNHDGLICGYDQENKTYCIYAYDKNWIYKKIWIPQSSFEKGRQAMFRKKAYGIICGVRPKKEPVEFSASTALENIKEYLDSNMEKYPENADGDVYGIVVHEYIAKYLDKLLDNSIPYEKMDWRVFRLIWEHKKAMLERITLIEKEFDWDNEISKKYEPLVKEADTMRMLYASYHMKRRDSLLKVIKNKLLSLKNTEEILLTELVKKWEETK